jgi:hypothetical protein
VPALEPLEGLVVVDEVQRRVLGQGDRVEVVPLATLAEPGRLFR